MNELLNQPLASIVTRNFKTAQVFEKYGLDFCCKGKRTLQQACEEKSLPAETVLNELAPVMHGSSYGKDFDSMQLSTLTDYIVNVHHAYVRNNMPIILNYLLKIATKHGEKFTYMKKVYIYFAQVRSELDEHLMKEEQVVFPIINDLEKGGVAGNPSQNLPVAVKMMEEEHDVAGGLMTKIREITNNYAVPDQACTTFRVALQMLQEFETDLHEHVYLENHLLFPKALALN